MKSPPDTTILNGPVEMKNDKPSVADIDAAIMPRDYLNETVEIAGMIDEFAPKQ